MCPALPRMPGIVILPVPGKGEANSPRSGLSRGGEGVPEGDVPGGEKERNAQEKGKGGEIRWDLRAVPDLPPFQYVGRDDDGHTADPRCPAPGTGGKARLFRRPEEQGGKNNHPGAKEQDGPHGTHPRQRNEEQDVPVADSRRPTDRHEEPEVIEDVPDGERQQERAHPPEAAPDRQDRDRDEHHDGGSLPADLHSEQGRRDLLHREDRPLADDLPEVDHHRGLDEGHGNGKGDETGDFSPHRPVAASPRRTEHVEEARATVFPSALATSHSTIPTVLPRSTTRAVAVSFPSTTGRRKLILSSSVLNDSPGPRVEAKANPMAASAMSHRIPPWTVPIGLWYFLPASISKSAIPSPKETGRNPTRSATVADHLPSRILSENGFSLFPTGSRRQAFPPPLLRFFC